MNESMSYSQEIGELAKALAEAQKQYPSIGKDRTAKAGSYSYDYADLATVLDAVRPALNGQGIAIIQGASSNGQVVNVTTRLVHASGQWVESTLSLEAEGTAPQKIGSALSYARRYGILALSGAAPREEDDDGALADHSRTAPRTQPALRGGTQTPSQGSGPPPPSQNPVREAAERMRAATGNVVNRMNAGLRWMEGRHGPVPMRDVLAKVLGRTLGQGEISMTLKEVEVLENHIRAEEERDVPKAANDIPF